MRCATFSREKIADFCGMGDDFSFGNSIHEHMLFMSTRVAIDETAAAVLLAALLLTALIKLCLFPLSLSPSLAFSRLTDLKFFSWRSRLASFPLKLHFAALTSLMIAFIDPHLLFPAPSGFSAQKGTMQEIPTEGIALYLLLDQSGSMAQSVEAKVGNEVKRLIPKIDLLKQVTQQFILSHPSDLIGLVSFARVPRVLVPLTLDQETLLKALETVQVVKSQDEEGTALGYALYKTGNILAATRHFANDVQQEMHTPYTIKSAVMIAVTDGFQDPSRLDQGHRLRTMELDDAASYLKDQDIRLYVVNLDPALSTAQYAPERRQLQTITAETGGEFYLVSDTQALQDIYKTIDHLEKGTISQETQKPEKKIMPAYTRLSLYPFFILIGVVCLFLSSILDVIMFRIIP